MPESKIRCRCVLTLKFQLLGSSLESLPQNSQAQRSNKYEELHSVKDVVNTNALMLQHFPHFLILWLKQLRKAKCLSEELLQVNC